MADNDPKTANTGAGAVAIVAFLKRYVLLLVVATLLGGAAAALLTWSKGDQYRASTRLFFTSSAVNVNDVYQATLAGQSRIQTYEVLASDPNVLSNALSRAGMADVDPGILLANLHVDVPPGTIIMDIGVDSADPESAARLANAVSDELIAVVNELERPLGGGPPPVTLTVVQRATPATSPVSTLDPITVATGAVIGFLLGCAIAFLLDQVRRRKSSRSDAIPAEPGARGRRPVQREEPDRSGPEHNPQFVDAPTAAIPAIPRRQS